MEHITLTINELQKRLKKAIAEVARYKKTINELCEIGGFPKLYPDADVFDDGSEATVISGFAKDAFYGRPLAGAVKMILEKRRALNSGPASVDDIYSTLIDGGYHFEGKEENRKTILRTALRKNIDFHRLPNGLYGLSIWYAKVKRPAPTANDNEADDDSDEAIDVDGESNGQDSDEEEDDSKLF